MTDLTTLLERAAGPAPAYVDVPGDLSRGHRALARTRRRRGAAGLAGVAAAGVLGVTLTRGGSDGGGAPVATDPTTTPSTTPTTTPTTTPSVVPSPTVDTRPTSAATTAATTAPTSAPTSAPTRTTPDPTAPVTGPAQPNFFRFDAAPEGWVVQGSSPTSVTFARPGDSTVPEDFRGKLALMFTANHPAGVERSVDGRAVWVADTGRGTSRVTVLSRPDEPRGHLELQFPTRELGVDAAIAFLTSVQVLDGAVAMVG